MESLKIISLYVLLALLSVPNTDMISCCFLDHQYPPDPDPKSAALVTYFEGVALVLSQMASSPCPLPRPTFHASIPFNSKLISKGF